MVRVGKEKQAFNVHKNILCGASSYFKAALDGGFVESQTQTLELLEDKVEVFGHFLPWLYSGNVRAEGNGSDGCNDDGLFLMIDLYLFGEMRGIPELQNKAIDELIRENNSTERVPTGLLNRIYDGTPVGSPLRRLMVDVTAQDGELTQNGWFAAIKEDEYPKEFLVDLVCAMYTLHNDGGCGSSIDFLSCMYAYHVAISEERL